MLQFSEVGETEALPAMSPFAMRNENLVVNRSTVRGNPVVEPAVPSRAPMPQPVVPTVAPVAPTVVPMPPTFAPLPPPVAPTVAAKPELPSMVYLLLGLNAITIALCLTLILARR